MLRNNGSFLSATDQLQRTITCSLMDKKLLEATSRGDVKRIQRYVHLGADINTFNREGDTPLSIAALRGHVQAVRALVIELGGFVNTLNYYTDATPAFSAAYKGHVKVVEELAELGANLNRADTNGATPTHIAAQEGHAGVIKALAQHEAIIDAVDNNGATPAHIAAQAGHIEVLNVLAEHGANLNIATAAGWTPVLAAARQGHTRVVKLLYTLGANMTPDFHCTLKEVAQRYEQSEVVTLVESIFHKIRRAERRMAVTL